MRPKRARVMKDEHLGAELVKLFHTNYSCLGVEKMHTIMTQAEWIIGHDQVRSLMRINNICGVPRGKTPKTTIPPRHDNSPEDRVNRNFKADKPNQLWIADITYVKTRTGFAYTAFITDVYTRAIIGWHTAGSMPTNLLLQALEQAIHQAKTGIQNVIHHSDKGSQYCSITDTNRLKSLGITPSTRKTGDAYDNALAESINAAYKTEPIKTHDPQNTIINVELATTN